MPALAAHAAVHAPAERAIVRVLNRTRRAHGLHPLRMARGLHRAARSHSFDMLVRNMLTHDAGNGTPFGARVRRGAGYRAVGENVAWMPQGTGSGARSVVRLWMHSPPHRAQLLSPSYRFIGVGRLHGRLGRSPGVIVTADFATR